MAETEYTDPTRGTIAYATSAKVSVSIGGVLLDDDVLGIDFTGSVSGTFDTETGIADVAVAAGTQIADPNDIIGRISPGVGPFESFQVLDLTNDMTPSDVTLFGQRTTGGTEIVRVDVGNLPTGGGGEANLGANVGAGSPVFRNKDGITLNFRSAVGTEVLEDRTNGDNVEIGFQDTTQGVFIARSDPGTGKPTFVLNTDAVFKKAFQSGFTIISIADPGRALTDADYRGHIELDATSDDATITLPDATGLAEPIAPVDASDPWCWIRVASGANLNIVTAAVSGRLRTSNGYNSHNATADTVYLGLSQSDALNRTYALRLIGSLWVLDNYVRDTATGDLTFDGPLQTVTDATASVTLTNATHGGKSVFLTNAGAVTLAVGGLTSDGRGVEVHKATVAGDVTVTGGIGATTIAAGAGALVRVRPDGVYVS